jgi:hypothetical protein
MPLTYKVSLTYALPPGTSIFQQVIDHPRRKHRVELTEGIGAGIGECPRHPRHEVPQRLSRLVDHFNGYSKTGKLIS